MEVLVAEARFHEIRQLRHLFSGNLPNGKPLCGGAEQTVELQVEGRQTQAWKPHTSRGQLAKRQLQQQREEARDGVEEERHTSDFPCAALALDEAACRCVGHRREVRQVLVKLLLELHPNAFAPHLFEHEKVCAPPNLLLLATNQSLSPVSGGLAHIVAVDGRNQKPELPACEIPMNALAPCSERARAMVFLEEGDIPGLVDFLFAQVFQVNHRFNCF